MTLKKLLGMGLIALAIAGTSDCVMAGTATPDSIIVMPARKRVVQLAFQISRCKDVGLVTYNNSPSLATPLIHVWNGQDWIQITLDDYVQGSFMSGEPRHVFILGDDNSLPPQMTGTPAWGKDVQKLASLDTSSLINQIGKTLNFSARQWKWLAEVNGLSIQDQNSERRRYGRWGAPGKEKDFNPAKLEAVQLPPAPIMTDTKVEAKPVVAPAVKPEAKPELTTEPKVDVKAEPKADVKAEPKADIKAEPKLDVKAEPKIEVKAEPKVEIRTEITKPTAVVAPPVPPVVEKPAAQDAKPVVTEPVVEAVAPASPVAPVDPSSK